LTYCVVLIGNKKIEKSVIRYLTYALGWNTISFNEVYKYKINYLYILVDEDIIVDEQLLKRLTKTENSKFVIIGKRDIYSNNCVNIKNISNLNANFNEALIAQQQFLSPLIFVNDLKAKLNLFFKGHGECSLIDGLNWTRYYLSNGINLLREEGLSWEEYISVYFKSGFDYWNLFKKRLEKYDIYLKIVGFTVEINLIKSIVENFKKFIDELEDSTEDEIKKMKRIQIEENIDYLKKTDNIFTGIKNTIDNFYHEV